MPTYRFIDTSNSEEFESFMSISARENFLKENPHIQPVVTAPAIVSGVSSSTSGNKVPEGFKEVLSKVAEAHPASEVAHRYGKKSIKEVKTREIVRNHIQKAAGK